MEPLSALLIVALASSYQEVSPEPGVDPAAQAPESSGSQTAPEERIEDPAEEGWGFLIKPYLFACGLDGTVRTGALPLDIDAEFDDLFSNLNFGAMLAFEVRPPASKWTIATDLMYFQLEENGTTRGPLQRNVDMKIDQFIGELSAAYELIDQRRLELLGGVRYWNLSGDLQVDLPTPRSASGSVDWIDPLLGVRSSLELGSNFDLLLRGDIGGFGVGSDIAFNVAGEVGWSLSELLQVSLGYRYLYVDYEDEVTWDMSQAGPVLGLAFRF